MRSACYFIANVLKFNLFSKIYPFIYWNYKQTFQEIFGSAEVEISHLEKQLIFREEQIEKLRAKCSLLQIELSSAFDASDQKLTDSISATNFAQKSLIVEKDKEDDRSEITEVEKSVEDDDDDDANFLHEIKENDNEWKRYPESIMKNQKKPRKSVKKKRNHKEGLESLESSAMIISSLNHELMLLMQVLILIFYC